MKNINENIDYLLLISKMLDKEATKEELHLLEDWKNENPENAKTIKEYTDIWLKLDATKESFPIDINVEWSKMSSLMDVQDDRESENDSRKAEFDTDTYKGRKFSLLKAAAIIIIMISTSLSIYFFNFKDNNVRVMAILAVEETILPDGSKIALNKGSIIEYNNQFDKEKRNVSLKGDAFFEVKRNEHKPFIISVGDVRVEVLGTSFYVDAMETSIEVVVKTGQVAVYNVVTNERVVLEPGQKAVFNKKQNGIEKTVNQDINYLAWKTRELVFDDTDLSKIVETLNKVYHCNASILSDRASKCRVTGKYSNASIDFVLDNIKASLDINIVKTEEGIEISGEGC